MVAGRDEVGDHRGTKAERAAGGRGDEVLLVILVDPVAAKVTIGAEDENIGLEAGDNLEVWSGEVR